MKEKDNIEEFILNNIDALNESEPLEGHFDRFEARLKAQNSKKKKFNFSLVWKVAAAVVFVFLAVNQAFIYFSPDKNGGISAGVSGDNSSYTLASVSEEYKEAEFYYTSSINSGIDQWNKLVSEGKVSDEEQNMMKDELSEFEGMYKKLQKDLSANPNDERVINAMLEYYQSKLSVINIIVEKLKEVQAQNESVNNNEMEVL